MTRVATGATLAALTFLLSGAAIAGGRQPADIHASSLEVGIGVVCNTKEQAAKFARLSDETGNILQAIKTVNAEAENPTACGKLIAAFVRGRSVGEVHRTHGSVKLAEITIVAVPDGKGWQRVPPVKQYTAFALKGIEI